MKHAKERALVAAAGLALLAGAGLVAAQEFP
jgi:hypothetical protein